MILAHHFSVGRNIRSLLHFTGWYFEQRNITKFQWCLVFNWRIFFAEQLLLLVCKNQLILLIFDFLVAIY